MNQTKALCHNIFYFTLHHIYIVQNQPCPFVSDTTRNNAAMNIVDVLLWVLLADECNSALALFRNGALRCVVSICEQYLLYHWLGNKLRAMNVIIYNCDVAPIASCAECMLIAPRTSLNRLQAREDHQWRPPAHTGLTINTVISVRCRLNFKS